MALEWRSELAVGIAAIDEQHQSLFKQAEALVNAMRNAEGREAVETMLEFLGDYVVMHFGTEEALMSTHRYPGLAQHLAEHQAFIRTFCELAAEFARSGPTQALVLAVNERVCDWLANHVLGSDLPMGEHLRACLGEPAPGKAPPEPALKAH